MVAAALLIELLAELALYVAAGVWLWYEFGVAPGWSVLGGLAAFLALRAAVVGIEFRLAEHWRAPDARRLSGGSRIGLFLREIAAVLLVFTFGQILQRRLAPASPATPSRSPAIPVLLVHGIYCNAGIWHVLLRRLQRRGIANLHTVNLEPPLAGIDQLAAGLGKRVEEVCRVTGTGRVVLLSHSMGGLVSRAYLAKLGGAQRVAKLITIASPHHGSELARLAIGRCGSEIVPGTAWLAALEAAERSAPTVPVLSIFSWHDNMVMPQDSAILPGVRNIGLESRGHLELLLDPEVFRLVAAEIAAADAGYST